jgi:hypothetical protein
VVSGRLPAAIPQAAVLSKTEFDAGVRAALRDLGRDDRLAASALCSTKLAEGAAELSAVLTEAVQALADAPRAQKQYKAVHTTYVLQLPNQEAVAERLGLPFSTYRRHLVAGLAWVCDWLWDRQFSTK